MTFEVTYSGKVTKQGEPPLPEDLEEQLDSVLEELESLGAKDATVGAALSKGTVEISLTVEAAQLDDAGPIGSALIQSAIHAAGGATPGWNVDFVSVLTHRNEEHQDLLPA